MEREHLLSTLKELESRANVADLEANANNEECLRVLDNDLKRTNCDFIVTPDKLPKARLINNLVYEILKEFPIAYTQGMSEVAGVVVLAYFYEKIKMIRFSEEDVDYNQGSYKFKKEPDIESFKSFLKENSDLLKSTKLALIAVIEEKFMIFIKNKFKLYKELAKTFNKVMEKKNVKIRDDEEFLYMGHILTFFSRVSAGEDTIFSLFNIVLNSEPSILFSLVVMLFPKIHKAQANKSTVIQLGKIITKVDDKFVKELTTTHELFIKTQGEVKSKGCGSALVFMGVAVSLAAVGLAVIFRMNDRK